MGVLGFLIILIFNIISMLLVTYNYSFSNTNGTKSFKFDTA